MLPNIYTEWNIEDGTVMNQAQVNESAPQEPENKSDMRHGKHTPQLILA